MKISSAISAFALFLIAFLPIPIYVDLSTFKIIWIAPEESFYYILPGRIPLPLGFFSFVSLLVISTLSLKYSKLIFSFGHCRPYKMSLLTLGILFPIVIFNNGSLIKLVQLYLPLILIAALPVIKNYRLAKKARIILICSLVAFVIAHLKNYAASDIDHEVFRYADFYGGSIYSSNISWTTTLSLYLYFIVFWPYSKRYSMMSVFGRISIGMLIFIDILLAARRESLLVYLILLCFVLLGAVVRSRIITKHVVSVSDARFVSIFLILLFVLYLFLNEMNSFLAERFENLTSDPERLETWSSALIFSPTELLFGNGVPVNNLHNLPLSIFVSFGLLGFLPYVFAIKPFMKTWFPLVRPSFLINRNPISIALGSLQLSLLLVFFISNMVNVSATQPFVLINLLFILMLVQSALQNAIRLHGPSLFRVNYANRIPRKSLSNSGASHENI